MNSNNKKEGEQKCKEKLSVIVWWGENLTPPE